LRTYGTLRREADYWVMDVEPHVAMMAKRVFSRVSREGRTLRLEHSPEACRQLDWLTKLYPLICEDRAQLDQIVAEHNARLAEAERILLPDYVPPAFEMAVAARDYQKTAAQLYLSLGRLLLCDPMGVGKTASAITALTNPATLPCVVICPVHLMRQWQAELAKFMPQLHTHILKRSTPYDLPQRDGRGPDVLITSYHRLSRGWAPVLREYVQSCVGDEAQELRHSDSQKYQSVQEIAEGCQFRMLLSGTPIHNYGGEMFNLLQILSPGCVGSREEFHREWCVDRGRNHALTDPTAFGSFLREQHLMLRRTRADVGRELPAVTRVIHTIDSDAKALDSIEGAAGELARTLLTSNVKGARMQAAGELDMLVRQATGIAKAPHVAAYVDLLLESGEPVILFAWHRACYDIWMQKLAHHRPAFYTGEESDSKKHSEIQRAISGETDLLIMSLRSGLGVNGLQERFKVAVFGELDWSPGVHEQCIARIHRDGQDEPVTVYFPLSESGSDPVIAEMLGLKRSQLEGLHGEGGLEPLQQTDPKEMLRKLAEMYFNKQRRS